MEVNGGGQEDLTDGVYVKRFKLECEVWLLCKKDHLRWGKGDLQVGQKYLLKNMDICGMTLDRQEGGFGGGCACACV